MNVAILGAGFIVPVFIENAKANGNYHLSALWGRNAEKIKKYEHDVGYVTDDLDKVLNDTTIDLVYVALPNALHYEYALKALEAGKHVLVEKPFTVTRKQADVLFAEADRQGKMVLEAIVNRYSPNLMWAKEQLKRCGNIKMIEGNFSQYSRRYEKFKNGEILPAFDANLAGGALMDLGVYNIHFVCSLFGAPKEVHYFANIEKGVDTSGTLILDYGTFKASLINAKDCFSKCHVYVQGDEGLLVCNSTASRCSDIAYRDRNGNEEAAPGQTNSEFVGFTNELKAFADILKNQDWPAYRQAKQATLIVMDVLEQAQKSAGLNFK